MKRTRVHKITLLVVDHDDLGPEEVRTVLENTHYPNRCISPQVALIEIEEVDWADSNPLNYEATWRAEFERLFPPLLPTCAKCGGHTMVAVDEALQARCTCE